MRKILVTGGPVHAQLDAVKFITNRFKGGLMAQLAQNLAASRDCEVTYLTAKGLAAPDSDLYRNVRVLTHEGYFDYRDKVLALAPDSTDVILGAAVANLVPQQPWKGKFPSHDYKEGEVVNIPFIVAPRVITQVKQVAPHVNLFGFKLLSDVPPDELVNAAYGIVRDAHATAVIANDTRDLLRKRVVTRERGVHDFMVGQDLAFENFLWQLMEDQHYRTQLGAVAPATGSEALRAHLRRTQEESPGLFVQSPDGLLFGTVALRAAEGGFWTTGRGKQELDDVVYVREVDHAARIVHSAGRKATLNAPLLAELFARMPALHAIVHGHVQKAGLPTLPYAQPGTVRDSLRKVAGSFNIQGHGCFLLYDKAGQLLRWSLLREPGPVPEAEWPALERELRSLTPLTRRCGFHVTEETYALDGGELDVDRDGDAVLGMTWRLA